MIDRRKFLLGITALIADTLRPVQAALIQPIRMGYFENYPPFSFRDENGQMVGALIDGVELVGHAAGLSFTHQGYPWVRAQALVESGGLDGFCTTVNQARLAYANFCSTPILTERFGMYHRADDIRMRHLHTVQDLRPFNQGSYHGAGYPLQYLEPNYIHWYRDEETILRMIDSGSLDIYVEGVSTTAIKLKELGLTNRIQVTMASFLPPAEFCFGLRRDYPDAVTILEKIESATSAAQKSGSLNTLLDKYR